MEREQYQIMFRREDAHWWYSGMRTAALALLRQSLEGRHPPAMLDAGCGTGGTTARLRELGPDVYGIDIAADALQLAATRGLSGKLARGSVERLPFRDGSFDALTSFEVLYHLGVSDDLRALTEFRRVLRPNGFLLLRLPAHDWLRGKHDRLVRTRHRYSCDEVADKLRKAGFAVEYLSWANSLLFPAAAMKRLLEGVLPAGHLDDAGAEPDLWQPPGPVNSLLERCVAVEARAFEGRLRLPFGLSVIALARAI
jgi:ubiquinone/menaquinone biosynthesis C-methylase UbiE